MSPVFDVTAAGGERQAVEKRFVVAAESRKKGKVMAALKNVNRVDLEQPESLNFDVQLSRANSVGLWPPETLCGQGDAPRVRRGERLHHKKRRYLPSVTFAWWMRFREYEAIRIFRQLELGVIFRQRQQPKATPDASIDAAVPAGMRIAGAWSWRILALAGVIALFIYLVIQLRLIVVPFLVAILLAALLVPFVQWLQRHRWPKWLAVMVAEVGLIGVISGLVYLIVTQVIRGFPDIRDRSGVFIDGLKGFLLDSPLHLTEAQISDYLTQAWKSFQEDSNVLVSGALSAGSSLGHVLAGILLVLFATLFFLIDGKRIWAWTVRLFPKKARPAVDGAGHAGWSTLAEFVKVQIFVAFIDAVGIGLGAWILGLFYGGFPLLLPIAIAVFLGSFIPVVGAILTGVLAVFVALVYLGPVPAVIMLAIVLLVQQIEGHVLQPFIMGTAVKVHPLAVVFSVAAGGFLAGIAGALFAVPIVATLNVMVHYIAGGSWRGPQSVTKRTVARS